MRKDFGAPPSGTLPCRAGGARFAAGKMPDPARGLVSAPLRSVLNECPLGIQHPLDPTYSRTYVRLGGAIGQYVKYCPFFIPKNTT